MPDRIVVCPTSELPPGERKLVNVKGRDIGVFNVKGELFALFNACPHEGAPLCTGLLVGLPMASQPGQYRLERRGEMLRCPWHGWEFDIRTGQSFCDPKTMAVRTYHVSVESGAALEKGPFKVETFPVKIEDDYVVVEI